jgi:hypothetical protein
MSVWPRVLGGLTAFLAGIAACVVVIVLLRATL